MSAHLTLLFAVSVTFVLAVFVALVVRAGRRRRGTIRAVSCPENDDRPALVLLANGDTVVDRSRWHDRRLTCGRECLDRLPGS